MLGIGTWALGLWDLGIWDLGIGTWALGLGTWALGLGDLGIGTWDLDILDLGGWNRFEGEALIQKMIDVTWQRIGHVSFGFQAIMENYDRPRSCGRNRAVQTSFRRH